MSPHTSGATAAQPERSHHLLLLVLAALIAAGMLRPVAAAAAPPSLVPSPPTHVHATIQIIDGAPTARVTWAPPDAAGLLPITGYEIDAYIGTATKSVLWTTALPNTCALVDGTAGCGITLTPIEEAERYAFVVRALNSAGTSDESKPSNPLTFKDGLDVPERPQALQLGPSNGAVTVDWAPPATDGGSPITGYEVTAYAGHSRHVVQWAATKDAGTTELTFNRLAPGSTYSFAVQAVNALGWSLPSDRSPEVAPLTVPAAPTNVQATPSISSATVSWIAPPDGGSPITQYIITAYVGASSQVAAVETADGSATSIYMRGVDRPLLKNGTAYTFTVTAVNALGQGPESARSNAIVPGALVPTAPSEVTAAAGISSATVSWKPAFDGGSPIIQYIVTAYIGTSSQVVAVETTVDGNATSIVMHGVDRPLLQNGTPYTFTVTAVNAIGQGPESARSNVVVPSITVPDAPADVTAAAHGSSVDLGWTAPFNGGAAITGYLVRAFFADNGALAAQWKVDGALTSATLSGLDTGRSYVFTVRAGNAAGYGAQSAYSNVVRLATAPAPPRNLSATAGVRSAVISWTPPSDGGSAIRGYVERAFLAGRADPVATRTVGINTTSDVFPNLADGQTYTFTVAAVNAIGEGLQSQPSSAITLPSAANAPSSVSATAGDGSATVTWSAPAADGGSPITGYELSASDGTHPAIVINTAATSTTLSGLTNDATYVISVTAINAVGRSPAAYAAVTPRNLPPTLTAPADQTARYGDTVSFDVSAADPEPSDHLELRSTGLPAGLTFADHGNGAGSVSGALSAAPGSYAVTFSVTDGHHDPITRALTITVGRADAAIALASNNPFAVKVKGTKAGAVTLRASVAGRGDLAHNAPIAYSLTSLTSGATYACTAQTSAAVDGSLDTRCTFRWLPVDLYRVRIAAGGDYYTGAAESTLAVFSPARGRVNAYGGVSHGTGRATFKVRASIDRNGRLSGQVTYREQRPAGTEALKSTRLDGLIVRGKRAYILGTATLNGQGAYRFVATVARGGSGKFGLWVLDRQRGTLPDLTFDPASVSAGRTEIV